MAPRSRQSLRAPPKPQAPVNRTSFLPALRATSMMTLKSALPAEILELILDYLPIPDLLRCARASKRLQEMVYDETRWVRKLQLMGCWNDRAARQKAEEAMLRKLQAQGQSKSPKIASGPRGDAQRKKGSQTLFDAGWEVQAPVRPDIQINGQKDDLSSLDASMQATSLSPEKAKGDGGLALRALDLVRSVRGSARAEYSRAYELLNPFYIDTTSAPNRLNSTVFTTFLEPAKQAKMLSQLWRYSQADSSLGSLTRQQYLQDLISRFEDAAVREFEIGCREQDVQGRMKQYAHVLSYLNGGSAAIERFIKSRRFVAEKQDLGNPYSCLEGCAPGHADLGPSNNFLLRLLAILDDEKPIIEQVFPPEVDVFTPVLKYTQDYIISEYLTTLFDEAHSRNVETYLKAVTGVLEQTQNFAKSIKPPRSSAQDASSLAAHLPATVFEAHLDLYLQDEVDFFKGKALSEVYEWTKKLSDQEASAETFYMTNVTRQAAKQDFLTSFRQVLMMPVNALPLPSKRVSSAENSRSTTPVPGEGPLATRSGHSGAHAPMTELAAKTAIMNSKLEGIGTLFSIDVSVSIVQRAKACIERLVPVSRLSNQHGADARVQIETIFVELLRILGFQHVKPGFDKAVDHLSNYNAREATEHSKTGVKPLVMFLELVNVGDLIQQMVDVFYVQELVNTKLLDRDDFLSPSVKEKKRFEQMLDERVAAGLNRGIDVLMDEVEYITATLQSPAEFNPTDAAVDIGPTAAAQLTVQLVSTHTDMLVGSTDKTVLDVFNQEVGLRLFNVICKHLKRQRISSQGAVKLISDINLYFEYIQKLRNRELLQYYKALRELAQIFLVDGAHGKEIAAIIADNDRYYGIFGAEEVYEFAERRADWYSIKPNVEKAMYGAGCSVM